MRDTGDIWWFGNLIDAENYAEDTRLTATITGGSTSGTKTWVIANGFNKVTKENETTTQVTIRSDAVSDWRDSDPLSDVIVQYRVDNTVVCTRQLKVRAPHFFIYLTHWIYQPVALPPVSYVAQEFYHIVDQYGDELPNSVEYHEVLNFQSLQDIYPPGPTDWPIGPPGSAMSAMSTMNDPISPPETGEPIPLGPYDSGWDTPVIRFEGEWRVGSLEEGQGLVVRGDKWEASGLPDYLCVWEKWRGNAYHLPPMP